MTATEFLYALPDRVAPEALEGKSSIFHFDLAGDGGGQYTVTVADDNIRVEEGLLGESKCSVRSSAENFMKVINGELNPLTALLFGKIKVDNKDELIKYAKIFGLIK